MIGTVSKYSCGVNSESGLTSDLKIRALTQIAAGLASYAKDFCLSCLLCKSWRYGNWFQCFILYTKYITNCIILFSVNQVRIRDIIAEDQLTFELQKVSLLTGQHKIIL